MRTLYPPIKAYREQHLRVDETHSLYIEEAGNPSGIPILFVHGGPGAGIRPTDRCFFNPEKYRIILFDQRGAGRSSPHASLENNTTSHLLLDMEKIRRQLEIEQWMLFGGSWGATLSLLYAQAYPESVIALVVRGVFLGRQSDFDWFYKKGGASRIFPEHWRAFAGYLQLSGKTDLAAAYYERLTCNDELLRMAAAKQWIAWEVHCATLNPSKQILERIIRPHSALSLATIEAHYVVHRAFIKENQILAGMARLQHVPGIIVHGRYDMICPLEQAYSLYEHWPASSLRVVRDAGHAACDPGIVDALVKATDDLASEFSDAS